MTSKKMAALLPGLALAMILGGCGYTLSPSPYGLLTAMTISVPVVKNQSPFANLGPMLTSDVITRLDASSNIKVREGAPASLIMTIQAVSISGGAWTPHNNDIPTNSASRVIYLTVEAVLERPNPAGGQPLVRRHIFNGSRNFHVSNLQEQVELSQNEAFQWLIDDLSQKIAQTMFSEF